MWLLAAARGRSWLLVAARGCSWPLPFAVMLRRGAFVTSSPLPLRAASVRKAVCVRSAVAASASSSSSSRAAQIPEAEGAASQPDASEECALCVGAQMLSCSLCNAFGFIKIDGATDWRTCHVCQGRGNVCCPQCCEPGTLPPVHFED